MKIVIISSILNPRSGARAPIDLSIAMSPNQDMVFISFSHDKDIKTYNFLIKNHIKVYFLNKSPYPIVGEIIDMFNLYLLLRKISPQVICFHGRINMFIGARLTGIPIVLGYHGTQFNVLNERLIKNNFITNTVNSILNLIIYCVTFFNITFANRVIAISKYAASEVKRLYGRSCGYIYNGAAPPYFFIKSRTKTTSNSPNKINLLSISRITPYKQFEKIIYTLNILSKINSELNISLTIAGSSPNLKYLEFLSNIKSKNIRILVNPNDQKLNQLYRQCDIYVTADKYLFFGLPILEAASFGKPAIAFDYAAAREIIVHGKTGYITSTEKEFTYYLNKLITDPVLRKKMGINVLARSRLFSWKNQSVKWNKVLKEVYEKSI
jgi:glycosyltransferase involved in cell wall biosynthesis